MPNYDFLNISPYDFEELVRDLLQKHFRIYFESFTNGKDKGIDFRHSESKSNDIIIQCKKYQVFSQLKASLKKEKSKIEKLNPERYILVTSVGLTPPNKDEILKLLNNFIKNTSDIFGKDDLNNLLTTYDEIEKKHFKLWLSSINVLQRVLDNDVIGRSEFEEEKINRDIKIYVQN